MASILDALNIAKLALSAQQYGMNVSQRNTVNVNNPNYTRQDVLFTDLTVPSTWSAFGTPGVELWAVRNRYLDRSISYELPALYENIVKYNSLREIDAILQGTSGGGLGSTIAEFFNSFTELSNNPTSSALRWQTIAQANAMSDEFNRIYNEIQRVQNAANLHIERILDEVNVLTAKIADLNGRIEIAHTHGEMETEYAFRDERQQYIEEVESKIGLLFFETESGSITVTTKNGDAIVLGKTSYLLVPGSGPSSGSHFSDIFLAMQDPNTGKVTQLKNITDTVNSGQIGGGEIGGYLQLRDELIPGYLTTLDEMAIDIVNKVNLAHAAGAGLDGTTGIDFFDPVTIPLLPSDPPPARSIKVSDIIVADPDKIAAAAAGGGVGDNKNAILLGEIGINARYGETYAALIYRVGTDQAAAQKDGDNQQSILNQLLSQRNSENGVSLNEEAINLIKYQRAYQASSRIVSVLNALSAEVLNFVR